MKGESRVLPAEPIDNDAKQPCRHGIGGSDLQFPASRISQEFKFIHARPQVVEYGGASLQQCAAVKRWFNTTRGASEQAQSHGVLQIGNDLRYDRLRDRKMFSGSRHAAPMHDGEKNLQVPQLELTT